MIQPTSPPALPEQMTIPPEVSILLHLLKTEPKATNLDLNIWFLNVLKQGPKCFFPQKNGFTMADYFQNFLTRKGYTFPVLSSKIHPRRMEEPTFRMRLMTQNSWFGIIWFTPKSCILLSSHWHQQKDNGDEPELGAGGHCLRSLCSKRAGAGAPVVSFGLYFSSLKVVIF